MGLIMSTWAHGNAVVAQHPAGGQLQDVDGRNYTAVVGFRQGEAATYEGTGNFQEADTWFHIPVPTITSLPPVGDNPSGHAFLDSFTVLFRAENCAVAQIQAWDGGTLFYTAPVPNDFADQQMVGDWTEPGRTLEPSSTTPQVRMSNRFTPEGPRHAMKLGLGISIRVNFVAGGDGPKRIVFLGAGADWHNAAIDIHLPPHL